MFTTSDSFNSSSFSDRTNLLNTSLPTAALSTSSTLSGLSDPLQSQSFTSSSSTLAESKLASDYSAVTSLIPRPPSSWDIYLYDPETLVNLSPQTQQSILKIDLNSINYQASGNTFVYWNDVSMGSPHTFQCVEYAYGRAMERGLFQNQQGIGAYVNGDAHTWDNDLSGTFYADRLHYQAGSGTSQARENSFVVWEGNLNLTATHPDGSWETYSTGPAGHVGFVEHVYADGSYLVSEGNAGGQPFHLSYVKPDSPQYQYAEFIYL